MMDLVIKEKLKGHQSTFDVNEDKWVGNIGVIVKM